MNPTLELVEEIATADLPLELKIVRLVAIIFLEDRGSAVAERAHEKLHMLAGSRQTAAMMFLLGAWHGAAGIPHKDRLRELVPQLSPPAGGEVKAPDPA